MSETTGALLPEIWVWLPRDREGALHPAAFELLHEARGLARRLEARIVALGDRDPAGEEAGTLGAWGVDTVRTLAAGLDPHPLCPGGASPLDALGGEGRPRALLAADDTAGKVLAPLWAAAHDATLVTGATGVTADGERFVAARPALAEQAEALVSAELARPLALTLIPGAIGAETPAPRPAPEAPAVEHPAGDGQLAADHAPTFAPDPETVDVADAERIVAFGRGAFTQEGLRLVKRLAELLGASLAGSRPAADEGWIPFARQVGLTGAIVHPRLYVAVGISGAPYHMVGVKEPETLIALNSDPEAAIFGSADLGVVGDLYAILPEWIVRLERGGPLHEAAGDVAAGNTAAERAP